MIEYKDIVRKLNSNKYYYGKKLAFELIKHPTYSRMFYFKDEENQLSADFYNISNAADSGRYTYMRKHSRQSVPVAA